MYLNDREGYIATITAVILMAIIIAISLVIASGNFLGRFDSQALELKDLGKQVALGCLESAKLKMKLGEYAGNEILTVGGYECSILPIETQGANKVIKASATVGKYSTNLKMTVDGSTMETSSLEEVRQF